MNDEQFEAVLDFIRRNWNSGGSPVADLRARDTAQREALARVGTQLAEMRRIVAGFLLNYDDGVGKPWERRLLDYARKLVAAKKFNAQAEQQEARNAEIARESLRPENQRIEPVEPLRVPHPLEALGALAGEFQREDRYIVIKRKDLERLPLDKRMPFILAWSELGPQLPRREYLCIESDWPEYEPTWAAIQARVEGRAALATQPAERECNCPKIGERFSAEKHGGPCPIHDAVRGAEHE